MIQKRSFFLVLVLITIGLLFGAPAKKTLADVGCCTANNNKSCQKSDAACDPGVKSCDDSKNIKDRDIDGNGTIEDNDDYNPVCFTPIVAPPQVKITNFGKLFSGAVAFLLLIAFILAFVYLILGGIAWLTSGGDKGNIENARNKIIAALIGLVIVASTWAIFQLVGGAIGFNILGGFKIPTLY